MNIIQRYKKLSFWNQLGVFGALTSILGIILLISVPIFRNIFIKSNKPILYLAVNNHTMDDKGNVSITFTLFNKGKNKAENVQIKFVLADSLKPDIFIPGERVPNNRLMIFQNDNKHKCLKFKFYSNEIIYPSYSGGMPFNTKLPFILKFKVGQYFIINGGEINIYYAIQHSTGDNTGTLVFERR